MSTKLPELSREEVLQYSRHLMLPNVGMEGQRKLKSSSVLIVGAGGLGSPAALYLAAAGVGRIGIIDYDVVDASNLQRQVLHDTAHVGQLKAVSARERLLGLNPNIEVEIYPEPFNSDNALAILKNYDLLVDGTDNFATRYLANDACVLSGKPYVYGAIYRFEGQVSVFDARKGACYRCLFAEPPPPEMAPTCGESGVFGVLPGTIGILQATEALKLLLDIGKPAINKLLLYDALELTFDEIQIKKNPKCKICGDHPEITELLDYAEYCGGLPQQGAAAADTDPGLQITPRELAELIQNGKAVQLIDVRDPVETQISHLPNAVSIPYYQLSQKVNELDRNIPIVLFCRTGVRSTWALKILRNAGFTNARNLKGGLNAWVKEIDPSQFAY